MKIAMVLMVMCFVMVSVEGREIKEIEQIIHPNVEANTVDIVTYIYYHPPGSYITEQVKSYWDENIKPEDVCNIKIKRKKEAQAFDFEKWLKEYNRLLHSGDKCD